MWRTIQENGQNEKMKVDPLSDVRSMIYIRISKLKRSISIKVTSFFKDLDVAETISTFQEKYNVVPADKAHINIVLIY